MQKKTVKENTEPNHSLTLMKNYLGTLYFLSLFHDVDAIVDNINQDNIQ